jgi:hypothetical protein
MSDPKSKAAPLTEPGTKHALKQVVQPGYYPGWDVLSQRAYWDAATRKLVEKRMGPPPPIRFFNEAEAAVMTAVLDRILPQDDRLPAMRIPLLPVLDQRLYQNRIEGFRYEDMPSDQQAYRWACEAFDAMAKEVYTLPFTQLTITSQEVLLQTLHDGEPRGAKDLWKRMNVERFWTLLLSDACTAYYAHPWAWNEVGYGGPAYPRGYMRLEEGEPEPWEFREQRYAWDAPADTLSDTEQAKNVSKHQTHHGQAGTH